MNCLELTLNKIQPFVRFAETVDILPTQHPIKICSYDHRIFYILTGNARVEIDSSVYSAVPGTLFYWMAGTPYCITPAQQSHLQVLSINFDFLQNNCATVEYIPMVSVADYQPEKCLEYLSFTNAVPLNNPLVLSDMSPMLSILTSIVTEFTTGETESQLQQSCLLTSALVMLIRAAMQQHSSTKHGTSYNTILKYIQDHYSEELTNHTLAKIFHYHPNYISQLITTHTGTPLHQYLLKLRIRQAIILLQNTDIPICEIAVRVGFNNPSYFSQYFKKCTGYSPSAFRIS